MNVEQGPAEPLERLLERFGASEPPGPAVVVSASLTMALKTNTDPIGMLTYLSGIGIDVHTLDDLMLINEVADEEELSAHRVAEGVAITIASQGDWMLFQP